MRFNITDKIVLLAIGAALFLGIIISGVFIYVYKSDYEREIEQLRQLLYQATDVKSKEQVEIVNSVVEQMHKVGTELGLPEDSIKTLVAKVMREAKYSDNGYFWADRSNGQNVFIRGSKTEGTMRWDMVDVKGNKLLHDIIGKALSGGGYSDYWWPRPNTDKPLHKRGYSVYYEPFDWVIGTGNYFDDIEAMLQKKADESKKALRKTIFLLILIFLAVAIVIVGISILIGRRLSKPIVYLSEFMHEISGKESYSQRIQKSTHDEIGMLYDAFNSLLTVNEKSRKELKKHREELEEQVNMRTAELNILNKELKNANKELNGKNETILEKNNKLHLTIKHLKETQAQLLQAEKMASIGILTAGVAHEMNNPLNYIMGAYVGLLRHFKANTFSENQKQVGKLIEAMKVGIDRSSAIVKGLNQFSRKSDSYDEECNIHEIIEHSLAMLHNQIKHVVTIERDFSTSDIVIKGNVGNLHQVFLNLLGNAVQAIESEGTITVKTEDKESEVFITLTDSGIGIPQENIQKITDPFFTTKDPGKGTGLGLSITYNIIKEHKGKLLFESEEGQGTSVKIILPKVNKS